MNKPKKSTVLFTKVQQDLPAVVPPYPKKGSAPEFLYVQITSKLTKGWYNVDEVYRVSNVLFWGFNSSEPCFSAFINEKGMPESGIPIDACIILSPGTKLDFPLPEYTMQELEKKVGHKFTLKIGS